MSTSPAHSVLGQTERGKGAFFEKTSINTSSNLSLACGDNVNYYKTVDHPIPTLPDEVGNTQAIFKTNQ